MSHSCKNQRRSLPILNRCVAALLLAFVLVGCDGSGGSDDEETVPPPATVNVSGTVDSSAGPLEGVTVRSYLVTAEASDGEQSSTVSDAVGGYTITVLPGTDTYLEFTKTDHAVLNSQFSAFAADAVAVNFRLVSLTEAETFIDNAFGGMGFNLADKAWIAVNVNDVNGGEADAVSITPTPPVDGGGALNCDGSLTGGNYTTPCDTPRSGPMYLAYMDADGEVSVDVGEGVTASSAPVRVGEVTFVTLLWTEGDVATAELQIETPVGGTVKTRPAYFDCTGPKTCKAQVPVGDQVALTAIAAPGYKFGDWEGCDFETSEPAGEVCMLTISDSEPKKIRVEFDPTEVPVPKATLSVEVEEGGTVTSNPAAIECVGPKTCEAEVEVGTTVILTATPGDGYTFDDWDDCEPQTVAPAEETCSLKILSVDDPYSILAEFDPVR